MDFAGLVRDRLSELGLNVSQAERMFGFQTGYLRSAVRDDKKKAIPSIERAKEICDALGLEFYLGLPRETGPITVTQIDDGTFTTIPRYDVQLSAGNGHVNSDDAPIDHLAFATDWLTKMGILASKACLVTVKGDSMQPQLHDGDLVLIDQRKITVRERRIYALRDIDGTARVKRLELVPNEMLVLRSDNPNHPTEFRTGEDMNTVEVLGEVIWSGHSWS